jgi:hypothetical protein
MALLCHALFAQTVPPVGQQILHVEFDGQGTSQEVFTVTATGQKDTYTANETWHAAWDLTIPGHAGGFPEPREPRTGPTGNYSNRDHHGSPGERQRELHGAAED